MSPKQERLYLFEWGEVRKYYRKRGIDPKLADAKRHELHKKALGVMKSSKAFTNADLDKVLATFRAISRPADLEAQLHQIDQPIERLRGLKDILEDLALQYGIEAGRERAYLKGIAANVFHGIEYGDLTEVQLQQIAGIMRQKIARRAKEKAAESAPKKQPVGAHAKYAEEYSVSLPPPAPADEDENPF